MVLDDDEYWEENGLFAFLPGDIPINFGRDSRVILVGEIEKFRSNDDGGDENLLFRAKGYYPIPEYLIPA